MPPEAKDLMDSRRSSWLRGTWNSKRNSGEYSLAGRPPSNGTVSSYEGGNSGNHASSLNLSFLICKMGHHRDTSLQSRNGVLKATHMSIFLLGGSGSSIHKSSQVHSNPPESWPDVGLLCRPLSPLRNVLCSAFGKRNSRKHFGSGRSPAF